VINVKTKSIDVIADLISASILIEALTPNKISTVSNLKGVKDLNINQFIYTSLTLKKHYVEMLIKFLKSGKLELGRNLRNIISDLMAHPYIKTNTSLGFLILTIPLTFMTALMLRDGKPIQSPIDLVKTYSPYLIKELKDEDPVDFYEALKKASIKHLGKYVGRIPSVTINDYSNLSKLTLWDVFLNSSYTDMVTYELINGYRKTLEAYEKIAELSPVEDFYEVLRNVHTYMLSKYLDTLILKARNLSTAVFFKSIASKWSFFNASEKEELDLWVRRQGVNPGSTSDIVATAVAMYKVFEHVGKGCFR